jgi:CDP-diglyceride synthetase
MNSYGATNNNAFNSSRANISKLLLMMFLCVQAIRQLIQVNGQAAAKTESRAGQVAAWMTITMTLIAGYVLYAPKTPHRMGLIALFVAAMGSGAAMIYDYSANKTQALAAEKNRLFFGIAHVLLALAVLVYLILSNM